ncbi:response regulator [Candidatus Binatia bacterium]|nr:response regulator [Candidatus Binatia bacterium]
MSASATRPIEILVVEDNPRHSALIKDELEIEVPTASVTIAPSVSAAFEALSARAYDLVLLDFRLPDGDGLEILTQMKADARREPVVFVTTSSSTPTAVAAMKIGAEDYVVKEEGYLEVLPFVVNEVLERARLKAERVEMEKKAARADRLSSLNNLMASIAHNLNNPLTTVRTFLELLPARYDTDLEFRTGYYKLVLEAAERIGLLISNMMRAVTVPSEGIDPPWSVRDLMLELQMYAAPSLRDRQLHLEIDYAADVPELTAPRESLKQALIVLVDNAVAFSPMGGKIRLSCRATGDDVVRVVFEVTDEGPGVPMADRSKIFDAFYTTRTGGNGIGLFVAQNVARAQGGVLEVGDNTPCGAAFSITLPVS